MPLSSRLPSCATAWTPKLFAGIAALMKRERGARKVTLPASTRFRMSSSRPSYQTLRLLLASNSRWLSKSTLTCRRCPTTPAVRIAYCGTGLMVGKPTRHPEIACCCSIGVHFRFWNRSALSSNRTLSSMPRSAVVPRKRIGRWAAKAGVASDSAGAAGVGVAAGPAAASVREGSEARRLRSQAAATAAGPAWTPRRPPGRSAGWRGTASGVQRNAATKCGVGAESARAAAPASCA